jgi:DNA-binding NarL/FixJ family response regulator
MEEGTMPRMNGVEATRRLKTRCPDLLVIILTVHHDPVYERIAMTAGADGHLLKKTAGTVLWPALAPLAARRGRSGPGRAITVSRAPAAEARQEFGRASFGNLPDGCSGIGPIGRCSRTRYSRPEGRERAMPPRRRA